MAKNVNKLIQLKGTLNGLTYVNSKTYDPHVRSKRGSKNPAPVNDILSANISRAKMIFESARPLFWLLRKYAGVFCDTDLWAQGILKRLWKAPAEDLFSLVQQLKGMDTCKKHPMENCLVIKALDTRCGPKNTVVYFEPSDHPRFEKRDSGRADAYRYQFILFSLAPGAKEWRDESAHTGWIGFEDPVEAYECFFDPIAAKTKKKKTGGKKKGIYVFVLKAEGGNRGRALGLLPLTRMQVLEVGECNCC